MKKIFNSKFFTIFIAAAVLWLGISVLNLNSQKKLVEKEVGGLETKIAGIEASNKYLAKILAYIDNPSFLEKEAKMKLNYKAPGENVAFVYRDNTGDKTKEANSPKEDLSKMSIWQKFWNWLMGK